jgi:hypothetical protein
MGPANAENQQPRTLCLGGCSVNLLSGRPIYSGYLGLFLFGAALVAVGLTTSSLVNNQIISALLSLSLFLLLWIIDHFG